MPIPAPPATALDLGGRRYDIAMLDIDVRADPATSRLITAYRRWLGY